MRSDKDQGANRLTASIISLNKTERAGGTLQARRATGGHSRLSPTFRQTLGKVETKLFKCSSAKFNFIAFFQKTKHLTFFFFPRDPKCYSVFLPLGGPRHKHVVLTQRPGKGATL